MILKLSTSHIESLGFDWPKYGLIEECCVIKDGKVDLTTTIENVKASRAFYKSQLNEAFAFKQQVGADYSDFTDRYDEYAQMYHRLGEVISYLEEIIAAAG